MNHVGVLRMLLKIGGEEGADGQDKKVARPGVRDDMLG
jgi:hypothetical protein